MDGVSCVAWKETVISACATTGALLHEPRQELGGSGPQPSHVHLSKSQESSGLDSEIRSQAVMSDPASKASMLVNLLPVCQLLLAAQFALSISGPGRADLCTSERADRGRIHGTWLSWAALWT